MKDSGTTLTDPHLGPGGPLGQLRLPTLTLVFGPDPSRFGERIVPGGTPFPLDRVHPVFPGGPILDQEVSRTHAEIRQDPHTHGFLLRDLGSKNGTFVNSRRVGGDGVALARGDVIRIGDTLILFHETLSPPPPDAVAIPGILGHSDAARSLRSAVARHAPGRLNVLLLGETGTGKELAARAIASLGRPGKPFLAFNAAAIPPGLVEATLFGHVRGAFTDARESRPGLFRAADHGTLFLDEVADLAPETQARLLRVLEERAVLPVGGTQPIPVEVRLLAATNRDLAAEVAAGRFRADLYARLAAVVVRIPPLRERPEDIPVLATAFAMEARPGGRGFSAMAMERLLAHPWPFNVRELKAIVEQAVVLSPEGRPVDLPKDVLGRLDEHARLFGEPAQPGKALDRQTVEEALLRAQGNVARAAAALGKDRGQFYRLLRRLGVDLRRFRGGCGE